MTISRRQAVKTLLATAAVPSFWGCARSAPPATPGPRLRLARVRVSPERVIREVVGLRPYRRSGFRVAAESLGDKTVIHNYGHGGGGVTLSWGTSELARQMALATGHRNAAVLGCGAVGLATARLLQDAGIAVTIYARDLPPATTSNIAGAQWGPVSVADTALRTAEWDAQFVRASRFSHRYFSTLVGPRYGVSWRENYFVSENGTAALPWEMQLIPDLMRFADIPDGEHPFGAMHVRHALSMHIEPSIYLPAVLSDFRLAAGRMHVREFQDRSELAALPEPLIVNCTGLGAGKLFGDTDVLPIKGQLTVLAPQADVDYITIGPPGLYMMPRQDGIVLGGTFERNEWSLEPNPAESTRIFEGHRRFFESMSA